MPGWALSNGRGEIFVPESAAMATTCWSPQSDAPRVVPDRKKNVLGAGWNFGACVPSTLSLPRGPGGSPWAGQSITGGRLGFGFADCAWSEAGRQAWGCPCGSACERRTAWQDTIFQDHQVTNSKDCFHSCKPGPVPSLDDFARLGSLPKPHMTSAQAGSPMPKAAPTPLVLSETMTWNVGKWDLMLSEELPSSLLENRSDTLASLATQSVDMQDEVPFFPLDEEEAGDSRVWCWVYGSDNSQPKTPSGDSFVFGASSLREEDQLSIASTTESLQFGMDGCVPAGNGGGRPEDRHTDPQMWELEERQGSELHDCGQARDPTDHRGSKLSSMQVVFDKRAGHIFGNLIGVGYGARYARGPVLEGRAEAIVIPPPERKERALHTGAQGRVSGGEHWPQFPSLTSVFGSCNGSNRVHPIPRQRPHLPSLNSVFGTCGGSSIVSNAIPHLPSLTSVFGSCQGCPGQKDHSCLTVLSELSDSLLAGEMGLGSAASNGIQGVRGKRSPGSNGGHDAGRMLLREGAHNDPFFDAEWNLIPMLNELLEEEARMAPQKGSSIRAKLFYDVLKDVPLVPQQHVLKIKKLGEGSYGRVSLGFCPGLGEIAVKWNKVEERPGNGLEFQHEASVLAAMRHPNIMELLGLVTRSASEGEVVGFMTEYAPYGTLSAFMRRTGRVLPLQERVFLALQVARGMAFIHSKDVVHFDLKPDNVLVQRSRDVFPLLKVADLGLARRKVEGSVKAPGSLRGTLPYMAPELVCDVPFVSDRVDVWAFGCMLQEMTTLEVPYSDMASEEIVMGLMEGWLRPPIPVCESEWEGLLQGCLAFSPQCRPSFVELSNRLTCLYEACKQDNALPTYTFISEP